MQVVYDNAQGMELNTFLNDPKYTDQLINSRVFYIVKPRSEDILKFGISGNNDGKGVGRLQQYRLTYGTHDPSNDCLGVKVYFVGRTNYNWLVEANNSEIAKRELYVKRYIKRNNLIARGRERTTANLSHLKDIMFSFRGEDLPTEQRVSIRETKGRTKRFDV